MMDSKATNAGMKLIYRFSEIGTDAIGCVGGKGANLAELVRAGFEVPDGLCVSTRAYAEHLNRNGLTRQITAVVERIDYGAAEAVEQASRTIRQLIEEGDLAAALRDEIVRAYRELAAGKPEPFLVAVRSSATMEDLPGASFAGQQDTYLDVHGETDVLAAVKRCWSSLWTARAMAYRQAQGFDHRQALLAVVIQEMCPAEVAGVLFTANPMTSNLNELVVNASWGLGEAVVAGWVNPDHYVLDKSDCRVTETRVADKLTMVVRNENTGRGTIQTEVPSSRRQQPCLSEAELLVLGDLGKRIEKHYGFPQDIEWARSNGRFRVLQAREITSLEGVYDEGLERWNRHNPGLDEQISWTRAWSDELWTGATTPLFYSIRAQLLNETWDYMYRGFGLAEFLKLRMWRYHKARPYFSCRFFQEELKHVPQFARTEGVLDYFPADERAAAKATPFEGFRYLRGYLRVLLHERDQTLRGWFEFFERTNPKRMGRAAELQGVDVRSLSDAELRRHFEQHHGLSRDHCQSVVYGLMVYGYTALLILQGILSRWVSSENSLSLLADLTSGLPQSKTAEENLALWDLAERIRRSTALTQLFTTVTDAAVLLAELARTQEGEAFLRTYRDFLAAYGHRGHADRDFSLPRWSEDPQLSIALLRMFVQAGDDVHPRAMMERLVRRRKAAEAEVEQILRRQAFGAVKARLFKTLVDYAQRMLVIRDNQRFYLDIITMGEKRSFEEFGRRLAERNVLPQPRDVYFLSKEEVYDAASGLLSARDARRRVESRARDFHAAQKAPPPKFLRAHRDFDDAESPATAAAATDVLSGLGTSSGTTTGTARVVLDLAEIGRIQKGDILVTNSTDPGWTPVFLILGGLVMETGGVLAHGSLISREHGIPAVSCVKDATKLIRDGERIVVDGARGLVTLSERSADAVNAERIAVESKQVADAAWRRPVAEGAVGK